MTCAIFYPRARLLTAVADRTSATGRTLTPGSPKPNTSVEPAQCTRGKSTLTSPSSKCRDSHLYGYKLRESQPAIDPISRSEPIMCSQLDANNRGPMDPGSSEGLKVGTRLQTCSTQATSATHHEQKGHSPHTDRDREDGHQRSDSSGGPLRRTISELNVSSSQKGWFIKTSGELEGLKQVHHA